MPTAQPQPQPHQSGRRASSKRSAAGKVTPPNSAKPKPWIIEFLRRRDALRKALESEGRTLA